MVSDGLGSVSIFVGAVFATEFEIYFFIVLALAKGFASSYSFCMPGFIFFITVPRYCIEGPLLLVRYFCIRLLSSLFLFRVLRL